MGERCAVPTRPLLRRALAALPRSARDCARCRAVSSVPKGASRLVLAAPPVLLLFPQGLGTPRPRPASALASERAASLSGATLQASCAYRATWRASWRLRRSGCSGKARRAGRRAQRLLPHPQRPPPGGHGDACVARCSALAMQYRPPLRLCCPPRSPRLHPASTTSRILARGINAVLPSRRESSASLIPRTSTPPIAAPPRSASIHRTLRLTLRDGNPPAWALPSRRVSGSEEGRTDGNDPPRLEG